MKKRLISFLLAFSMMLSLVPTGTVAHAASNSSPTTISISFYDSGTNYGRPTTASGTGWSYDSSGNGMLTIQVGYQLNVASNVQITCQITNNGVISGGNPTQYVYNYGIINGGTFAYTGTVKNKSGSAIKNGSFYGDLTNEANSTISGGSISAHSFSNSGIISGGSISNEFTNQGTISGGTFTGIVSNSGTITGGNFKTLYSRTAVTVDSFELLAATVKPTSGKSYTITGDTAGDGISIYAVNDRYISYGNAIGTLYVQTSGSTKTIKLRTNNAVKSINGTNFSGCTKDTTTPGPYVSTIDLSKYDADATLTLSTVQVPTADLEILGSLGGKPNTDRDGVIKVDENTYKGKGWEYKQDDKGNMTLYITDSSIVLNSDRVRTNAVNVPVVTSGDIAAGNYNQPVTCGGDIYGSGSFDNVVICNGTILGSPIFNAASTVTASAIKNGTFYGKVTCSGNIGDQTDSRSKPYFGNSSNVTNNGTIYSGTFYGTVNNSGSILGGTFNGPVISTSTINDGTFNGAVTSSSLIRYGLFKGTVTVEGSNAQIFSGTFEGPVNVTGTGVSISNGLFLKNVTLENGATANITGGVFTNNVTGSLKSVSIKGEDEEFTVNGYSQHLTNVYILPTKALKLVSEKELGFINNKKIESGWGLLSNDGKTITFTINDLVTKGIVDSNADIVLAYALEEPTAKLYTVTTPKNLVYGDTFVAATAEPADNDAGKITAVKYYKVTDGTADEDTPLTADEVKDAGTYQVVLEVAASGKYSEGLVTDAAWRFAIAPKPITAKDITFTPPTGAELVYNASVKQATVTVAGGTAVPLYAKYDADGTLPDNAVYTEDAPKDAGTYSVTAQVTPDENHVLAENLEMPSVTFTIQKANLTEADFTMTGEGAQRTVKLNSGITGAGTVNVTPERVADITTQSLTPDTMESGIYQFHVSVTEGTNYNAVDDLTSKSWQFRIEKRELDESSFTITIDGEDNWGAWAKLPYNGKTKEVKAEYKNTDLTFGDVTVTYEKKNAAGEWDKLDGAPTDAGTYRFTLNVASSTNNAETVIEPQVRTFTIQPYEYNSSDFDEFVLVTPDDMREDGKPKDVSVKTTLPDIYPEGKAFVWKLYTENDDGTYTLLNEMPTKAGTYYYFVWVKRDANHTGVGTVAAFPEDYTTPTGYSFRGTFNIYEPVYYLTVDGGTAKFRDAASSKDVTVSDGEKVEVSAKTRVYLTANADTAEPEITLLTVDDDTTAEDDFQWYNIGKTEVEIIDPTSRTGAYFDMPYGDVHLSTTKPVEPAITSGGSSSAGTGVALVLSGAALGGAAYLVGTELWMQANLPAGAAIPTNRQQLADLLWDTAGKPEPASTALFTDISAAAADSQKAARWCVEQGLMEAEGDTFQPAKHTFRPQVIKAWKQLQAGQKAG